MSGDGGVTMPSRESPEPLPAPSRVQLKHLLPFLAIHLVCVGVIWVGVSWVAVGVAFVLYWVRMFVITGFYHRYFSHRSFKTSRVMQALMAAVGTTTAQRGPMWWAAWHRHHHRHSDDHPDIHSPHWYGLLWSHMFWFNSDDGVAIDPSRVPDLMKYPELRFIERWHMLGPLGLAAAMFVLGWGLAAAGLNTSGAQMLVWGFGVSTVVLYHCTFTINSLAHMWGRRRFKTKDDSRNNLALALVTMGEGWHNNHHFHPGSSRQGFYWWEIDVTYYILWAMSKVGLVWELRGVPERVYHAAEEHAGREHDPGMELHRKMKAARSRGRPAEEARGR